MRDALGRLRRRLGGAGGSGRLAMLLGILVLTGGDVAVASTGGPVVFRVDPAAPSGGDGETWASALDSLDAALDASRALPTGETAEIWLRAGVYTPSRTADGAPSSGRDATFALAPDVTILGGFAGWEVAEAQRDPAANPTTLTGELGDPANVGDNAFHVVSFVLAPAAELEAATIDGVVITRGNAIGEPGSGPVIGEGGGMVSRFTTVTLRDVAFVDNRADNGGAISTRNGALIVESCRFDANVALGDGGAINAQSELLIENSSFQSNDASFGGAMIACCRPIEVNAATFVGNTATWGGGLYLPSGQVSLTDIEAFDNTASRGGFLNTAATTQAVNVRAGSNTGADGGAIYNDASLWLTNAELVRNLGFDNGGAIHNANGAAMLRHVTMLDNRSFLQGGGVYVGFGVVDVANAIVAENSDGFGEDAASQLFASGLGTVDVASTQIDRSIGGLPWSDMVVMPPAFVDRRGPDGVLGTVDDDLTPTAGAAAVDAADPAFVPQDTLDIDGDGDTTEPVPIDVAGDHRLTDDPDRSDRVGSPADFGARERQPAPPCPDIDGDGSVTGSDLIALLGGFGQSGDDLPGDVTGDGAVTGDDLITLLGRFGQSCAG
jgi:predicted outer membrane repeat protein